MKLCVICIELLFLVFVLDGSVNDERFDVIVVGGGYVGCEVVFVVV